MRLHNFHIICGLLVASMTTGCAMTNPSPSRQLAAVRGPQVETGQPNVVIDGVGWVIGIPKKVVLWNLKADNHDVSPETGQAVANYLNRNGMDSTKVRLNQYNPADEWRRLRANDRVSPGWRYTFGAITWAGETILPGRIFGGDYYNPFTDTVNIYSDIPGIAIHEGAYAVDNHHRAYPGTYGALQYMAPFNLGHEWNAVERSMNYVATYGNGAEYAAARKTIHPLAGYRFGSGVGSIVSGAAPIGAIAGAVAGHVTGRAPDRRPTPPSGQYLGLLAPVDAPQATPQTTPEFPSQNRVRVVGHEENASQPSFQ